MQLRFRPRGAFAYGSDFAPPVSIHPHDIAAPAAKANAAAAAAAVPAPIFKEGDLLIQAVAGHHGDAPAVIYRIDHAGKSVTFSGDIDDGGLPALRSIAKGTDLLVFNSVVLDPPGSPALLYTLHTPPLAIGDLAKAVGARGLLLSHLSVGVDEQRDAVLKSIRRNYQGPVAFAND